MMMEPITEISESIAGSDSFIYNKKSPESLDQIAQDLERSVPVRDNRHGLRVYKKSFIGSECVDFLVRANFANSRAEAVELGRKLSRELNLFEHVNLDHELKDDYLFYKFIESGRRTRRRSSILLANLLADLKLEPDQTLIQVAEKLREGLDIQDRTYRLKKYSKCFIAAEAVTCMIEEGLASSRPEAVALGRLLERELDLFHHVTDDHKFRDEYLFFRMRGHSVSSSLAASEELSNTNLAPSQALSSSATELSRQQLDNIADQLRRGVLVKNRSFRLKTYRSCFIASEAIDFMVQEKLARSREEAVDIGRQLAQTISLWYHVTNDHVFADKHLFFRFSSADRSVTGNRHDHSESRNNSSISSGSVSDFSLENLSDIASKLLRGIRVKDRTYQLKKHKSCFVGSEAVDFMVQARLANSRQEAVAMGQKLANELNAFHHVTKKHPFEDAYLFYRFSSEIDDETSLSTDDSMLREIHTDLSKDFGDTISIQSELGPDQLLEIGEQLRCGVRVSNRNYRLKNFRNCFVGSEAVDFLVQARLAESRVHAVAIGRRLAVDMNFLYHVSHDHSFGDDYLFYCFTSADRKPSSSTEWSGSTDSISSSVREAILEFQAPIAQKRLLIERNDFLGKSEIYKLAQIRKQIFDGAQVALVAGHNGSGKSTVVESAFAGDPSLLYATAKFDQRVQIAPFVTLRFLFSDLCKRIQLSGRMAQCQESLVQEFCDSRKQQSILVAWMPEMLPLFSGDSGVDEKRVSDNTNCIKLALQSFLQAVSTVMPVVLCLDDLMWSDKNTLDILQFLLNRKLKNVLLCATYLSNEVGHHHPLSVWRSEVAEEVHVETIMLKNLTLEEVQHFLAATLRLENEEVEELAVLIKERTLGNLFFLIQLLETLQNLALLVYDYNSMRWIYSVMEIRSRTRVSDNVAELLSARIAQLPRCAEQLLKLASCFGSSFDPQVLEAAKSVMFVFEDIYYCLSLVCKEEFLIRVSDREYKFAHDQVQSAAYKLLPSGPERKLIHWDIGRKLSKKRRLMQDDDALLACADQMVLSEEAMLRLVRSEEKSKIAQIFLAAGERAMELSAFVPASKYLKTGGNLLGGPTDTAFRDHYELAVNIFSTYARTELSAGHIVESRQAAELVLAKARSEEDKRAANLTLFRCLTAENRLDEQVEFAIGLLEDMGQKIPRCPNFVQVTLEFERARCSLKLYTDDEILSLPAMTDTRVEFCMDLLTDVILAAHSLGKITFVCFTLARLVRLTFKHGLCKFTPLIFVLIGQDLIASFNDLKEGYRYLQVGLRCQKVVDAEEKGRALTQSCMALGCVEPISKCMYLALDGYKASMEVGDIHNAFHGSIVYLWSFLESGLPIKPLLEDVEKFSLQMLEYRQHFLFFMATPIFQMLLNLTGSSEDPSDIEKGKAIEMNDLVPGGKPEDSGRETIYSYGMQLSFFLGDIEKATAYYEKLKDVNFGILKATILYHVRLYFFALVCIENFRVTKKNKYKTEAKKYIETLQELVENGAINLTHKVQLLDAEYCSLTSKDTEAVIRKYENAIVSATRSGFLQDGALSDYLCAKFCLGQNGFADRANNYLLQSYAVYTTWGASAVADSVKRRHPLTFPDALSLPTRADSGFRSRTHFRDSFVLMHKSLSKARSIYKK